MALEEQLEGTRITRKGDTRSQIAPPPPKVVTVGRQCASRSTITLTKTYSADIYRCIKRRVGRSLKRAHSKGNLVPSRKLHINHLELKAVFLALKEFQDLCSNNIVLVATDNTTVVAYINKEGGMKSASLCALLSRILSWCTRKQVSLKARHIPGQLNVIAIQTWPDHSNGVVPSPRGVPSYMLPVASTPGGLVCYQIQQQTSTVCVTGSRPPGLGSGRTRSVLGRSGPICLPTSSHLGQSGGEVTRVAQHALVLGSSGNVQSDFTVSAQPAQSGISTIQPDPAQEPVKPEPTCLAPRATAIKEHGFSEAVAARIEAPQRGSTRSVYEAKWTIFTKWCITNQVDFRAHPVKSVVDFLMYLFEDRKLQPCTIDGTDQPLLTSWVIPPLMSAKMRISLVSWMVSIETGPRAGGVYRPGTSPWSYTS